MAFELRDGQGTLFKNGRRENENQPNARGECKIDGVLYEIAAWTKKDKNGNPWQSLSIKPKEDRKQEPQKPTGGGGFRDMENDIPFASCAVEDDPIWRKLR